MTQENAVLNRLDPPAGTVVIHVRGQVEAVYADTNVRIYLIDLDEFDARKPSVEGPYQPTAVKTDLGRVFPGEPALPDKALHREPEGPYFSI
jgi:hypothetical protein